MFSGVLDHFITAQTLMQNGPNWSLTHKFVERSGVGIFRNERTRSAPWDPKLMFSGVSNRFITARTSVHNGSNWSLAQKFVERSGVGIFRNERTDPPYWIPNSYFRAFWTISLLHELGAKWAELVNNAQVRGRKSHWNFLQRTHAIHPIGPKLMFWGISDSFVTTRTSMQNVSNWCH
jgi:hypothetical protein